MSGNAHGLLGPVQEPDSDPPIRAGGHQAELVVGMAAAVVLYTSAELPVETDLIVPFFKSVAIPLGAGYVVLAYFVIVGTSNAVNLTDGLDGLAILFVQAFLLL